MKKILWGLAVVLLVVVAGAQTNGYYGVLHLIAGDITDTGLTSGNCVQAGTGGLLTTTGSACGSGGGIANIQVILPTTAVAANACTTPATATMTGLATTSVFDTAFATNPNAVTGWGSSGGLSFTAWPTTNTLNWSVCNSTGSSITPGTMTLNVGAR